MEEKEKSVAFKSLGGREYQGHKKKVHSVAWNCTGTKPASGSVDHNAGVWNIDAHDHEKAKLQEELAVYKSAMSAMKADNKVLREKLDKIAGDQEAVAAERSAAAVKAYKTSLPCRQERLDGIRRAWEGLTSTLIQGGKITVANLGEVDPFPYMASDPVYKEEGFDLTDDLIHQVFDLLDGVSEG